MKKRAHMICNAHIDPIWQWDWPEGVSAVLSTFGSAVRLAEEFDYVFCHNEVTAYKYVEEYAPSLFEKIKALVKAGKWHIMGGWYLQPDCNMPAGESFVRQIREGQRYFKEKFGTVPTAAINFDPFGHTVGLVQIIKRCGQDGYIFMRPYPHEMELPRGPFWWRGLDGSKIKAWRSDSYNTPLGGAAPIIKRRAERQTSEAAAVLWGVGNHGGGPSRKDLSDIQRELLSDENLTYIHSTPEAFFAEVEPTAEVSESLRISMPGCYTSMSRVKARHAQLERELYMAERMAAAAYFSGAAKTYPTEALRRATQDLLNAEFHDVLPGTSVQCGEEAGLRFLSHGLLEAERVKVGAYFALSAAEQPAREGEYPVVVFNPHPYRLTDNVECEFSLADQNWDEQTVSFIRVLDKDGNSVPYQVIKEDSNLTLDWRKRIIFEADMAPLSLSRYSVFVDFLAMEKAKRTESLTFDNGRKHVEINPETGLLSSYRIDGVEYLAGGMQLVSLADNADPWAMAESQLKRVGEGERAFALSGEPTGVFRGMKSVQVIEDGDIYLGVEAFFEDDNTRARIGYKIYKNSDAVDVDVTLFLGDIDRMYKLKVPMATEGALIGQTAFGTEPLFTDARENVAGRFVALEKDDRVIAVMNRETYGSHFENGALYLSLVRGATYCAHPIADRPLLPTDRFTRKIDQGENRFSFRLLATTRDALPVKTEEFVMQPFAQNIFPVYDAACRYAPLGLEVGGEGVVMAAMKKEDEGERLILRLHNNTAHSTEGFVTYGSSRLALSFGRYEVKTVLISADSITESAELLI